MSNIIKGFTMWKSFLTLSMLLSLLGSCNFSDKPGDPKKAPVMGEVKNKTSMFAYKNYNNIKAIYLVGTLNEWDETADPFDYNPKTNVWELDIDIETGLYYYKFLVHYKGVRKQWILDPNNPISMKDSGGYTNSAIYVNPYGRLAKYQEEATKRFSIRIEDKKVSSVYISGNFRKWSTKREEKYALTFNIETGEWEIPLTLEPGVYFYKYVTFKKNTRKVYKWFNDPQTASKDLVDDGYGGLKDRIVISPWKIEPISDAAVYYCNDDASITSVTMKIVDTLNYEKPTELYSYFMRYNPVNGCWERDQVYLSVGRYEYKFAVKTSRGDEQWIHDPKSNSFQMVVDKFEEGAFNSLFTVGRAMQGEFEFSLDTSKLKDVVAVYLVGDFNDWDNTKDLMDYNGETKTWILSHRLTRGKYGYKFRIERFDEGSFEYPLFLNDPKSVEAKESDEYGYHSILTVY